MKGASKDKREKLEFIFQNPCIQTMKKENCLTIKLIFHSFLFRINVTKPMKQ